MSFNSKADPWQRFTDEQNLRADAAGQARVQWHPRTNSPRRIYGRFRPALERPELSPEGVARQLLARYPDLFKTNLAAR